MKGRVMIDVSPEFAAYLDGVKRELQKTMGRVSRVQASNHILNSKLKPKNGGVEDAIFKI